MHRRFTSEQVDSAFTEMGYFVKCNDSRRFYFHSKDPTIVVPLDFSLGFIPEGLLDKLLEFHGVDLDIFYSYLD